MMLAVSKKYLAVAVTLVAIGGPHTDAFAGEASDVVAALQTSLVAIMRDGDTLGYQGRYRVIEPVVRRTHDLDKIARLAVGRHWKGLTAAQQSAFIRTFHDLSISTYAGRFKNYGGEQFVILSEKPLRGGARMLVASRFVKTDGEHITFNYIVHRVNNQWAILNISVNGISDLALKRAEYGGVLQAEGFPTLLQRLRDQILGNARGH